MTKRFDSAVADLSPPFNLYDGRDTSQFAFYCDDDGLTRQEFADECDLNVLMARYEKTGLLPQHPNARPVYGDFADLPTFQEAQHIIMAASDAFASLPARVRKEFDNDPAKFVEFASDPQNVDQMRSWGLAKPLDAPSAPLEPNPADKAGSASEPAEGDSAQ